MIGRTFAALGVFACAGAAHAGPSWDAVDSQSLSFSGPLSPFDAVLHANQFDDNGGLYVLLGVCLSYEATVSAGVTAENDSALPAPDFAVNLAGFIDIDFATLSDTGAISESAAAGVDPSDGVPGSGPDFHDFGTLTDLVTGSDQTFFGLGPFIGGGTIPVTIHAEAGFSVSGSTDSTIVTSNFMITGKVTIEYKYNIPTPGAAALMGVAGLGAMRRRR